MSNLQSSQMSIVVPDAEFKNVTDVAGMKIIPVSAHQGVARLSIEQKSDAKQRPASVIYTLDKSGSMAGAAMRNAVIGIIAAINKNLDNVEKMFLIVYDVNATIIQVTKNNQKETIQMLERLSAGNRTSFTNMFIAIEKIATENFMEDFVIYIFTDGEHMPGYDDSVMYQSTQQSLKILLKNRPGKSCVKTRAFSNGVDVPVMSNLTTFGMEAGDFQYANSAAEITSMLENDEFLHVKTITGTLHIGDSKFPLSFYNNDVNSAVAQPSKTTKYEAQVIIDVRLLTNVATPFIILNGADNIRLNLILDDSTSDTTEQFDAMLFAFGTQLKSLATQLVDANGNKPVINKLIASLQEFDRNSVLTYDNIYNKIKSRIARKQYGARYNEFRTELGSVISMASNMLRGASSGDMARILNVGHSVARRGLQKRLDTLALTGVAKLESADQALMNLQFEEKEVNDAFEKCPIKCMITLSTPAEAVLDSDMMCMTGFMTRPEVAIASADQIRIEKLNSLDSAMLWSVFSDELLKGIDDKPMSEKAAAIHGGFDVSTKMRNPEVLGVATDAYRGKLNFAYPLYINPTHWQVAKHYLPRVVAWMSTLDFAAQAFDQIRTIPFVVMGHAMMNYIYDPTEHSLQVLMNTMRVAWQVKIDYNLKHIQEEFETWLYDYAGRVPKVISNLFVFLTKLMFVSDPDVDYVNQQRIKPKVDDSFWISVFEELLRRDLAKKNTDGKLISSTFVADRCEYKSFVNVSTANAGADEEIQYAKMINPNASISSENKGAYVAPTFSEEHLVVNDPVIDVMIQRVMCNVQGGLHMIKAVKHFYEMLRTINLELLFIELDVNNGIVTDGIRSMFNLEAYPRLPVPPPGAQIIPSKIEPPFGMTQDELYRMIVLNNRLTDNNTRELSKESYLYGNSILIREVASCIQSETSRQTAVLTGKHNAHVADLFARTDNLETAMGIIRSECPNVGAQIFHDLLTEMQKLTHIPHREAKLKMLVDGYYDVEANGDTPARRCQLYREGFTFAASYRNRRRLIYAANVQRGRQGQAPMTRAECNELFRWSDLSKGCCHTRNYVGRPIGCNGTCGFQGM